MVADTMPSLALVSLVCLLSSLLAPALSQNQATFLPSAKYESTVHALIIISTQRATTSLTDKKELQIKPSSYVYIKVCG
jgi:hypothetical protein